MRFPSHLWKKLAWKIECMWKFALLLLPPLPLIHKWVPFKIFVWTVFVSCLLNQLILRMRKQNKEIRRLLYNRKWTKKRDSSWCLHYRFNRCELKSSKATRNVITKVMKKNILQQCFDLCKKWITAFTYLYIHYSLKSMVLVTKSTDARGGGRVG